jgi:DinB family protein
MSTAGDSTSAEDLRYPIGRFQKPEVADHNQRMAWMEDLERLPAQLRAATGNLDAQQLDTPYRPGGWTVLQLVHHLADSHINGYARFRLALTEQTPLIKPYDEKAWAELPDARTAPIGFSLSLIDNVHARLVRLLRSMTEQDFMRTYRHPETGESSLAAALALYAWHSRHHLAHIENLKRRNGW